MEKIEIEFINNPYYYCTRLVAMCTGYTLDELLEVHSVKGGWRAKDFIKLIHGVGFNCDHRFKKFQPATEHPCLLRSKIFHDPSHWEVCVYYDGQCYVPGVGIYSSVEEYQNANRDLKITSMLQVWI